MQLCGFIVSCVVNVYLYYRIFSLFIFNMIHTVITPVLVCIWFVLFCLFSLVLFTVMVNRSYLTMIWTMLPWWPCGPMRCHWLLAISHYCPDPNPTGACERVAGDLVLGGGIRRLMAEKVTKSELPSFKYTYDNAISNYIVHAFVLKAREILPGCVYSTFGLHTPVPGSCLWWTYYIDILQRKQEDSVATKPCGLPSEACYNCSFVIVNVVFT